MSSLRSRIRARLLQLRARFVSGSQPRLLAKDYQDANSTSALKLSLQLLIIVLKSLIALAILVALLLGGTLAILLGTIISSPEIDGERLIVQRNTWPSGDAPVGEIITGNKDGKPSNFIERIEQEIISSPDDKFVAVILAQPGDRVRAASNGDILVNGLSTRFSSDKDIASVLLTDDYLGICINGGCGTPGTPLNIPSDNLVGSVQGKLSGIGITRYELPSFLE